MKNKIATFLLAFTALQLPSLSRATLFWYEGFQYPDGSMATTNTTPGDFAKATASGIWIRNVVGGGTAAPSDMYVSNQVLQDLTNIIR